MTPAQMAQLSSMVTGLGLLVVIFGTGALIGWAIADTVYKKKLWAFKNAAKAEARNELLWEMQNARQAPPADGPVYRA